MERGTSEHGALSRHHLRFGWCALLAFLTLGIALETFHGFKVRFYLDVASETRRLMWTLAHAHGTLLALIHFALARTLDTRELVISRRSAVTASRCLSAGTILLPGGFFVSGFAPYGGDPGLGILLLPPGALALLVAVFVIARAVSRAVSHD